MAIIPVGGAHIGPIQHEGGADGMDPAEVKIELYPPVVRPSVVGGGSMGDEDIVSFLLPQSGYCAEVLYGLLVNDVIQQMVGIDGGSQVVSVLELLVVGRHGKTHPVNHQVKPDFRLLVGSHFQLPVPGVEHPCCGKEQLLIFRHR